MDDRRPLFSLIVPTRQRNASLRRLLDSLARTTRHPQRLEVVPVVDGDDAASRDVRHDRLTLRHAVVAPGATMGSLNRAGYLASSGDFIMLLNDDVVVRTRNWDNIVRRRIGRFPD